MNYSHWNKEGLIPAPNETEQEYLDRVDYCLNLKNSFKEKISFSPIEPIETLPPQGVERGRTLYAIAPTWIPLFYSNSRLPFWQGGCAWIFQETEDTPQSAFFQLRRALRNSEYYLKYYPRDELVAHELCHVGRMGFEEPRYEELLAYRTSKSHFRRYWGPLFTTSFQSSFFTLILFFIFLADTITLLFQPEIYLPLQWLKLLPLSFLLWLMGDLIFRQRNFEKCLQKLASVTTDPEKLAYRLTDREIDTFRKMTPTEIDEYCSKQTEFRWEFLRILPSQDGGKKLSN